MVSSILSTYTSIQMSHTAVILSVKRDDNSMVVRRLNHKSSFLKDKTVLQSAKEFGSWVRPPKIPDILMLIFSIFLGIFVIFNS